MSLETTIDDIAGALVDDIESLAVTPTVKAYKWGAGGSGLDAVPAAVVQLPTIRRSGIDRPEDHVGALDVGLTFEVFFFFDYSSAAKTLPQSLSIVTAFIDKIDGDITLGANAAEAKVVSSEPVNVDSDGSSRKLYGYSCTVEVEAYV